MQPIDELNLLLGIGPPRVKLPVTLQKSGYTAVKPIGKGGFGQAHLIFHAEQNKYFVVKHVNMAQMSSRQRKDAHNEIDMLQQLDHPNIIRYVEYVEEPPNLYIVMEYADGGDLHTYLKKYAVTGKMLPEDQVIRFFAQTASALQHMHDRRMLHRDIKAQNVFLTKANVVKLGDFGISTVLSSTLAMAQTMCGTPCYFSPELCQGKAYNSKSDVWALGVLLYEMCAAGELPFEAPNVRKLMDCICREEPRPIPTRYSSEMRQLIVAMLAKDPTHRPSIAEILDSPLVVRHASDIVGPARAVAPSAAAPVGSPPQLPPRSPARSPPPALNRQVLSAPQAVASAAPVAQSRRAEPHLDVMLAEPPAPFVHPRAAPAVGDRKSRAEDAADGGVPLQPHQHFNDTNAGTAYQPALLRAAARRAVAETVDDWSALTDREREAALRGEGPPNNKRETGGDLAFLRTSCDDAVPVPPSVAAAEVPPKREKSVDFFNDRFMTTLDTDALLRADEVVVPACSPSAPIPSQQSPVKSARSTTRGGGDLAATSSRLRLTANQRRSLKQMPVLSVDVEALSSTGPNAAPPPTRADATEVTTTATASSQELADDADTCIGGHCLCGASVYAGWLSMAIGTFTCGCMACRRFSGSERVEWIHFPDVRFSELLQHAPSAKTFVVVPGSVEMYFCGECGSTLAMCHADIDGCIVARATLSDTSAAVLAAAVANAGSSGSMTS